MAESEPGFVAVADAASDFFRSVRTILESLQGLQGLRVRITAWWDLGGLPVMALALYFDQETDPRLVFMPAWNDVTPFGLPSPSFDLARAYREAIERGHQELSVADFLRTGAFNLSDYPEWDVWADWLSHLTDMA